VGSNSATGAASAVIVVPVCRQMRTRNFNRLDRLKKPLTPLLCELDFPLR